MTPKRQLKIGLEEKRGRYRVVAVWPDGSQHVSEWFATMPEADAKLAETARALDPIFNRMGQQ